MIDSNKRIAACREKMKASGVDLVAIGPGSHMDWLLGSHPHPDERLCLLLIGTDRQAVVTSVLNNGSLQECSDIEFHTWADAEGPNGTLLQAIAAIGSFRAKKVVLDETMRADFALLLLGALPKAKHDFTDETVGALRMRKDAADFKALKMNACVADRVMEKAFSAIKPGLSETELELVIKKGFWDEGATPALWIAASGANSALPFPQAGRKIEERDVVLIDIGGRKDGFASDITRMAVVGHPPVGYTHIHAIVEEAVQAALKAARPGVLAKSVDAAARAVIAHAGYGEYFIHRLGHGIGIDLHEPPYINATSATVLEEGMVFSIEPGIYLPGRFGIRLEEIVKLRDDGLEILSSLPRDVYVAG